MVASRSSGIVLMAASFMVLTSCGTDADAVDRSGSEASAASDGGAVAEAVPEVVAATVETEPVPHDGDAADDPAVWVHPRDPSLSAVVATDKQGGLLVYDLAGRELQYLPVGEVNNVDVRSGSGPESFVLGGRPISLVVAGNRSSNTLVIYEMDQGTRQLRDVTAGPIEPNFEVYGSCVYRSAATGSFYAFVNSKNGDVEQWQLSDDGSGKVKGDLVRSFGVGSQTEGCVADDGLGHLYLGEETEGIWKFSAEPDGGDSGTLIAAVSPSGPLVGQVEGLSIAYGPNGTGHLFASSQGNSSYAVFTREGSNAYVGSFSIGSGGGIDRTDDTDGIDVSTANLGPAFPRGLFVAQDGKNDDGAQNFKLVPYERVFPG
jgi:3-phytase